MALDLRARLPAPFGRVPADEAPPLVTDDELARFYRAVALAKTEGAFASPHGPLEVTAWLHVTAHLLESMDTAARRATRGELDQLLSLRTLVEGAPATTVFDTGLTPRNRREAGIVKPAEPLAVAVSGVLLDQLDDDEASSWARRSSWLYALGVRAIEQALLAARAYLRGEIEAVTFEAAVEASNTYRAPMANDEGTDEVTVGVANGSEAGPPSAVDQGSHLKAPAERQSPAHESSVGGGHGRVEPATTGSRAPKWAELDPLSTPLGQSMSKVLAAATVDGDVPQLLRGMEPVVRGLRSTPGRDVPLSLLASAWPDLIRGWSGDAAARPAVPDEHARPHDESRDECDRGPQAGGRWEIARVDATETAESCPPAQAVDDLSARVYGKAGAALIKAQNEWINAKECFSSPDTRKCAREEDKGYNQCTQERDDGYNECSRQEDRGYRDCCDWAPCSWFCRAWVWISNLVCVAWTWITNIVCVAWTWIKNIVCVAWVYLAAVVCAIPHLLAAAVNAVAGVAGIFVAAALRGAAGMLASACRAVGWSGVTTRRARLRVVGVHLAVLHTGKVMLFNYDEGVQPVTGDDPADFTAIADSDRALCALWDPRTGEAKYVKPGRNVFCSHHAFAPDGRLFVAAGQFPLPGLPKSIIPFRLLAPGADRDVHLFDPVAERWDRLDDMALGRWYPTCATMADGKVFVISGTNGWATETGLGRGIQDTYEISDPSSRTIGSPIGLGFNIFHLYPFVHTLPSGQLFIHFKQTTAIFDPPSRTFGRIAAGSVPADRPGGTVHPFSRTGPGPGTCVLLPFEPSIDEETKEVSYSAGRIMILGGGGAEGKPDPVVPGETYELDSYKPATDTAEILDLGQPDPQWRILSERMHAGRVMPDTVLLPTGEVLVVGGGRYGQSGGLLAHFTSSDVGGRPNKGAWDPVFEPELFDPASETWRKLCPKPRPRLYHTTAALLPDGRVLVAGHDGALNMRPYDESQYDLELFSPPYLFDPNGQLATRPAILAAPGLAAYREHLEVAVRSEHGVERVSLIRQSSTTHQINSDQRCIRLSFELTSPDQLDVLMPPGGGVAPPGYYMLFVVDRRGVPSEAHWLRLTLT